MHRILKTLLITGPLFAGVFLWSGLDAAQAATVNCNSPNASIQNAVDNADGPTTIQIKGICFEDVTITKDDITLSGQQGAAVCNKAAPGGTGTINGTVTVDGVRATIEFLTITGSGAGVDIVHRANAHLTCNDISANEAYGVSVARSSNAVLRDNTLSGNGTRRAEYDIFWDCGLSAGDASSVYSTGNTYADNRYCAIDVGDQSVFRNGAFQPYESGHPANPDERDVITAGAGEAAIDAYTGGQVQLRNADVNGMISIGALSAFRVDGDVALLGDIDAFAGSAVRIKDRSNFGDRVVTFNGTLTCDATSETFSSEVKCGQSCSGPIPGSCVGP